MFRYPLAAALPLALLVAEPASASAEQPAVAPPAGVPPAVVLPVAPSDEARSPTIVSPAPGPACPACTVVTALTPVSIEVLAALGSKISKTGDMFPIRLAAPIVINGREAIPAGATGHGEVIHAKKSGGMGAAGELVLAARYVEVAGKRLRLRSFQLVPLGNSAINRVDAFNAVSAAGPIPVGLLGFFVSGGQANVAKGTIAQAKTAEDFVIEPEISSPAPASSTDGQSTAKLQPITAPGDAQ